MLIKWGFRLKNALTFNWKTSSMHIFCKKEHDKFSNFKLKKAAPSHEDAAFK
ncbi:MAG: hypothetical protein JWP12_1749 [Bacteroidetes bacterium]|nr:hypothetical protein [Bacteroidota bacterium]